MAVDVDVVWCPCGCHAPDTESSARSSAGSGGCTVLGGCGALHQDHRCRRGGRCSDWDWVETTELDSGRGRARIGRLINTAGGICPMCTRHVENALRGLPRDYVELTLIVGATGSSSGTDEPVARTRELPIPLRLGVLSVLEDMVDEVTGLAEAVAERLQVEWDSLLMDRHTRPAVALDRACRLLAGSLSVLLAVRDWPRMVWAPDGWTVTPEARDGVEGALACLALHHRARLLAGRTRLVHRMPVDCVRCGRRSLFRDNGSDEVYCGRCPRRYTAEEYCKYTSALATSRPL